MVFHSNSFIFFSCLISTTFAFHNRFSATKWVSFQTYALKYDPSEIVTISLTKPLGLVLEEVEADGKSGVFVGECTEGGNAKKSGKISRGYYLLEVNGIDTRKMDFDSVMDILINAPTDKEIDLTFIDYISVIKGAAKLTVKRPTGETIILNALKGQNMRQALLESGLELYNGKGKFTNCGGGGSCGTCAVEVFAADWETRQEFESRRLKKYSKESRLACNTIIEGDATVVLNPE
eukprot:CAMPEP_0182429198 /NCGR_PEP_ID=MMETSP1167-20130531/25587_1 /TAXON_ID=2988 /ORGANISM="Mallomonas Sp, Strain CCMP3275" /LENGTH=234 /DNA_ID=CAMNT_0024612579 /DNA_START=127 /DNA_END=828 /DNA_ORIENTATION=-